MMRKFAASSLAALAVVGGVSVVQVSVAEAAGRHCVTRHEFNRVHRVMSRHRVERIFDTHGTFAGGFAGGYTKTYWKCGRTRSGLAAKAAVSYANGRRAVEKQWS
jgi:hypothetical protein